MVAEIWVNIGTGNGLLPDDTKPLPEPMLTYNQRCSVAFTWEQFHKKCLWTYSVTWDYTYKITATSPGGQGVKTFYEIYSMSHANLCWLFHMLCEMFSADYYNQTVLWSVKTVIVHLPNSSLPFYWALLLYNSCHYVAVNDVKWQKFFVQLSLWHSPTWHDMPWWTVSQTQLYSDQMPNKI